MPTLLLNTIALDPNRWTKEKDPFYRLAGLLPHAAKAGFHRLEVWHYHLSTLTPEARIELREKAEALGVSFPIVGLYPALDLTGKARERELQSMERLIDEAATLGARVVKVFAGRLGSSEADEEVYARSVSFAQALAERAARHGLTLTAETHPDTLCDTVPATRRFLRDVAAPNLRLCYQPFDFTDTPRAVADYEALHEHVVHIHLQGRRSDRMNLLETADIDYRPLFCAFADKGFEGDLCIEFVEGCVVERPEDFDLGLVLTNARRDRDTVERLADEVGLGLR